jgi:uncharacterized protein DUF3800
MPEAIAACSSAAFVSGRTPNVSSEGKERTVKILFLDESGDHNLSVIDPQYPLFVLGGVIIEKNYAEGPLVQELSDFKRRHFGTDQIVLHTADIVRNCNGFERMKEKAFREAFFNDLNSLMRRLSYMVVACAIRKEDHLLRYGVAALDPYLLSLDVLVERFCFELGGVSNGGVIVAECRDPILDRQLDIAWLNLKVQGTRFISVREITRRIVGLNLRAKRENIAGLQLADLVVSPIGRHVLGKPDREDFKIVETKFRKDWQGVYEGFGLVTLPKKQPAPATQ